MRIPLSTYRLQFNREFPFSACRRIAGYLNDLGITDIYASPVFKAKHGSMHGYDVVDHNGINPELGSEQEFRELVALFRSFSMGWLQDIVPNHMAFDSGNAILMDVLESNRHSRFFNYFDIEWDHPFGTLKGRVLVPLLGTFYSEALENGEISLAYGEEGLFIRYYDLRLPLRLGSYGRVFGRKIDEFEASHPDNPDFISFLGALRIFEALSQLEPAGSPYDQIRHAKRILWDFYNSNPVIKEFMDSNIAYFNGTRGEPASFDPLDTLLGEQSFRLSFWKVATEEINYRRFFTINELISLRVEDEAVMDHSHRLILSMVKEGTVTGLRVDHIDGLYDPTAYLARLAKLSSGVYIIVEKILAAGEELPAAWKVQGTTGYDFMRLLTGLTVLRSSEREIDSVYTRFSGMRTRYDDLVADKKRLIIGKYMAGNIDNLATLMKRISENDRYGRDITLYGLKRALVELAAFFPVYRTYIDAHGTSMEDRRQIDLAHDLASARSPGLKYEMDFIRKFLLQESRPVGSQEKQSLLDFVMRFQQFTAPIMAKGFEDTVLYVYNRLISLNEVGASPGCFGASPGDYHSFCRRRQEKTPYSFNATATHDTKRGEDVRQRINVLSELPGEWRRVLREWSAMNARHKTRHRDREIPDRNDEYFLYQTLVGAFPFEDSLRREFAERMKRYVVKAVREAKVHTAWIKPDHEYEDGCIRFCSRLLEGPSSERFMESFLPFQRMIAFYGVFNSLTQVLLKCTSPGIPDFYQGTELWDFCLVDPDNRSPVDFEKRSRMLALVREGEKDPRYPRSLLDRTESGEIKLFVVHRCLHTRRDYPDLFTRGAYIPVTAEGCCSGHVIAYCRTDGTRWCLSAAPLLLASLVRHGELPLGRVWQDTRLTLPPGAPRIWRDAFTGAELRAAGSLLLRELFASFPLGLLISSDGAA